jgi:hypothetical protein
MTHPTFQTPRLQERAVPDEAWLKAMLHSAPFGSLGMVQADQPYVKPTLFAYDEAAQVIYFHGALEGRTRTMLEQKPNVCFTISQLGRLLPAKTSSEFGIEYSSVIVFGKVSIVEGELARSGLQLLLDKYFAHLESGQDYQPITEEEMNLTTVYSLSIESWSGKAYHAKPDYPDAFYYEHKDVHDWRNFS